MTFKNEIDLLVRECLQDQTNEVSVTADFFERAEKWIAIEFTTATMLFRETDLSIKKSFRYSGITFSGLTKEDCI